MKIHDIATRLEALCRCDVNGPRAASKRNVFKPVGTTLVYRGAA